LPVLTRLQLPRGAQHARLQLVRVAERNRTVKAEVRCQFPVESLWITRRARVMEGPPSIKTFLSIPC
jgi:hypothetical protein